MLKFLKRIFGGDQQKPKPKLNLKPENFKNPYLVQRLRAPTHGFEQEINEAFSFGDGYKNGRLGEKAMKLLCSIFSFDYMGAAEFEFGAVPEALRHIATYHNDYVSGELEFESRPEKDAHFIVNDYYFTKKGVRSKKRKKQKIDLKPRHKTLYYIVPQAYENIFVEWITEQITGQKPTKYIEILNGYEFKRTFTNEPMRLDHFFPENDSWFVCRPEDKYYQERYYTPEILGWLDLDNKMMYFQDKTMWEKTKKLFRIEEDKNGKTE